MRAPSLALVVFVSGVIGGAAGGGEAPIRVRASEAAAPCVRAAVAAFEEAAVVETGAVSAPSAADVLVGGSAAVNRALEGGLAAEDSDVDVARIPWVLVVDAAHAVRIRTLEDLGREDAVVSVLGGADGYEAERAAQAAAPGRVRAVRDGRVLRKAAVALVPVSMAARGAGQAVSVPALVVRAAVTLRTARPDAARRLTAFLTSEKGQAAFSACGAAEPPASQP